MAKTPEDILSELRAQGITSLDQLAGAAAALAEEDSPAVAYVLTGPNYTYKHPDPVQR